MIKILRLDHLHDQALWAEGRTRSTITHIMPLGALGGDPSGLVPTSTSLPSRFPVMPSTASMTPILGSRSSDVSPTRSSLSTRWCTAESCFTPSDRHMHVGDRG